MQINILQVCANYPPIPGGHGVYARNLSNALYDLGVNTTVLTFKSSSARSRREGKLDVVRISALNLKSIEFPIYGPNILYTIHKLVKKQKINVINSHTRFFTSTYFTSLYRRLNRNVLYIHTEHGSHHLIHKSRIITKISESYDHIFGKSAIQACDIPIAVAPSVQQFLLHLGCHKDIVIVPNSVDCALLENLTKNKQPGETGLVTITFIGRLVESKGVADLIKVFSKMEKEHPVQLWVVGDGPYRSHLEDLAKSLKIQNIAFLGFRADVSQILANTDIFVNPSYYDTLPTTVLEAGCLGIRVIATDIGDIKFALGEDYKFTYNPGSLDSLQEHLINVINTNDFHDQKLKDRIRERFNWKVNAKRYMKIIEDGLQV